MTNNERFNRLINECEDPLLMLNALMALAPIIRAAKNQQERESLLTDMKEAMRDDEH